MVAFICAIALIIAEINYTPSVEVKAEATDSNTESEIVNVEYEVAASITEETSTQENEIITSTTQEATTTTTSSTKQDTETTDNTFSWIQMQADDSWHDISNSGYSYYCGNSWNGTTGQYYVNENGEIIVQQLSSQWCSEWGFQIKRDILGLDANTTYTYYIDLKANTTDGMIVVTDVTKLTGDIQTARGSFTTNDNGAATVITFGLGYVGTTTEIIINNLKIYDEEGKKVYCDKTSSYTDEITSVSAIETLSKQETTTTTTSSTKQDTETTDNTSFWIQMEADDSWHDISNSDYSYYCGNSWNGTTGQYYVNENGEIIVQQLSSQWCSEWGFQIKRDILGLDANTTYTYSIDLKANTTDVLIAATADNLTNVTKLTGDIQTARGSFTTNDNGAATVITFGLGYVGTTTEITINNLKIYDEEGKKVYCDKTSSYTDEITAESAIETSSEQETTTEKVKWAFDEDTKILTISGEGDMENYGSDVPWKAIRDDIKGLVIQDGITSIGGNAFDSCRNLTSVVIPNSVTSIKNNAFDNCRSLATIIIPNSVTSLGNCVFESCVSLTNVVIPDSITSIGEYAFNDCASLISITIPASVTYISSYAFELCNTFTIYGYTDSYAQKFARANNISFVALDATIEEETTTTITTTTNEDDTTLKPVGVAVMETESGDLNVAWQVNENAQYYKVYLNNTLLGVSISGFYEIPASKITAGNTYTIGVQTVTSTGESEIVSVEYEVVGRISLDIYAYQISTKSEGFRLIFNINNYNDSVVECGMIYGISDYCTKDDMVIGSKNRYVYNHASTEKGFLALLKLNDNSITRTYVMTMPFIDTKEFYRAGMYARAYVKLDTGEIQYSDVESFSMKSIAEYLYKNHMMNDEMDHDYLYDKILHVAEPDYEKIDYRR